MVGSAVRQDLLDRLRRGREHPGRLRHNNALLSRQRLVDLVVFEYRSLVVRTLGVTAEWWVLEWMGAGEKEVTPRMCERCPLDALMTRGVNPTTDHVPNHRAD
jgi:hypothetical protein